MFLMLALANIASRECLSLLVPRPFIDPLVCYAAFFFLREEQPRYPTGFKTTLAMLGVGMGLTVVYA